MTPNNIRALLGGQAYAGRSGGGVKGRNVMSQKDADLTNAYNALRGAGGFEALGGRQKALLIQDDSERQQAEAFRREQKRALLEEEKRKEAEELELEAARLKLAQARRAMMGR